MGSEMCIRDSTNTVLPVWFNFMVLWVYSQLFSCKLKEAERDSLTQYTSLGDFFTRRLKPGMRPICLESPVVSPADGKITWQGKYSGGFLQQVKGVHYSLNYFLGLENSEGSYRKIHASTDDYKRLMFHKEGTSLFQCVIYLAPGDYHRFHSPADWTITKRRYTVRHSIIQKMPPFRADLAGLGSLTSSQVASALHRTGLKLFWFPPCHFKLGNTLNRNLASFDHF